MFKDGYFHISKLSVKYFDNAIINQYFIAFLICSIFYFYKYSTHPEITNETKTENQKYDI